MTDFAILASQCIIFRWRGHLLTHLFKAFIYLVPEMKIAEFSNSIDPDEVAHKEPPHLDLQCLPSSL